MYLNPGWSNSFCMYALYWGINNSNVPSFVDLCAHTFYTPDQFYTCNLGWLGEEKMSCILRHCGIHLILAYSWASCYFAAGKEKLSCILHHCGVHLILAYSWARPAILQQVRQSCRVQLVVYLTLLWCPPDIGLQLGKACYFAAGKAKLSCILRHCGGLQLGKACFFAAVKKCRGGMFLILLFLHFHSFSFVSCLSSTISSISLLPFEDHTKWPTRVDMSLNPNSINLHS